MAINKGIDHNLQKIVLIVDYSSAASVTIVEFMDIFHNKLTKNDYEILMM